MNAEEFLKQRLDMKTIPLSLTFKNDKLFALMEEYHETRMRELPEITDKTFSGQPDHTESPLELRICTRCNKEFKAIGACPICPSCYL